MRRAMARQATAFALGCALAWPALSQGLFDDNEARRRVELLRQQVEASQKALEDRLGKLESSTGERGALLDLAGQLEGLRSEIARMRGQIEVLANQIETADRRQKDLYVDIDTRLLELSQARVDVDVQVLLAPVGGLDLVGEDLDLPAHAGDFGAQPLQLPGEIEQRAALAGRGLELAKTLFERLLARLDLLAQQLDAATRFVVVEKPLRKRGPGERAAERESSRLPCHCPAHQYSPL